MAGLGREGTGGLRAIEMSKRRFTSASPRGANFRPESDVPNDAEIKSFALCTAETMSHASDGDMDPMIDPSELGACDWCDGANVDVAHPCPGDSSNEPGRSFRDGDCRGGACGDLGRHMPRDPGPRSRLHRRRWPDHAADVHLVSMQRGHLLDRRGRIDRESLPGDGGDPAFVVVGNTKSRRPARPHPVWSLEPVLVRGSVDRPPDRQQRRLGVHRTPDGMALDLATDHGGHRCRRIRRDRAVDARGAPTESRTDGQAVRVAYAASAASAIIAGLMWSAAPVSSAKEGFLLRGSRRWACWSPARWLAERRKQARVNRQTRVRRSRVPGRGLPPVRWCSESFLLCRGVDWACSLRSA